MVFTIERKQLDNFNMRLADCNKKLSKCGFGVVAHYQDYFDNSNMELSKQLVLVDISTDFDKVNLKNVPCTFLGVADLSANSPVYSGNFGCNISAYITDLKCYECGKNINRSKYLIFKKSSVENITSSSDLILLGSTCAKKYFPFDVQSFLNRYYKIEEDLKNDFAVDMLGLNSKYYDLSLFFNSVLAVSDNARFYEKDNTKYNAIAYLNNDIYSQYPFERYQEHYAMPAQPLDFDLFKAWLIDTYSDRSRLTSDFDLNINSILFIGNELQSYFNKKFFGYVAYLPYAFRKSMEKAKAVERKKTEHEKLVANSVYYGNVKDKFEMVLTFDKSIGFDSVFGFSYIHLFHDSDNHVFKWSTNKGVDFETGKKYFEVGAKYLVKGSIKAHEVYNDIKQTVITRCKVAMINK